MVPIVSSDDFDPGKRFVTGLDSNPESRIPTELNLNIGLYKSYKLGPYYMEETTVSSQYCKKINVKINRNQKLFIPKYG